MQVNDSYSNAILSCLPGHGVCESISGYYTRVGGIKFSAEISTETLAWSDSDNEGSIRNEVQILNYCTGARLPSAEPDSHDVVMFAQNRNRTQILSAHSLAGGRTQREFIASPDIHHQRAPDGDSIPKSSFQRFRQRLLQCILPYTKFQK